MGSHANTGKTLDSERQRLTGKMGLTEAQAAAVLGSISCNHAVPAAKLALLAREACGSAGRALELMSDVRKHPGDSIYAGSRFLEAGLVWEMAPHFRHHVEGAAALLRSMASGTPGRANPAT